MQDAVKLAASHDPVVLCEEFVEGPELTCPVLVFWGANDRMMPDSGLLAVAKNTPNMKMIVLSECGHWAMVEHEDLFNRECLAFVRH